MHLNDFDFDFSLLTFAPMTVAGLPMITTPRCPCSKQHCSLPLTGTSTGTRRQKPPLAVRPSLASPHPSFLTSQSSLDRHLHWQLSIIMAGVSVLPSLLTSQSSLDGHLHWQLSIIMEFCDGGSLLDAINQDRLFDRSNGRPKMRQVLSILTQVTTSLHRWGGKQVQPR